MKTASVIVEVISVLFIIVAIGIVSVTIYKAMNKEEVTYFHSTMTVNDDGYVLINGKPTAYTLEKVVVYRLVKK